MSTVLRRSSTRLARLGPSASLLEFAEITIDHSDRSWTAAGPRHGFAVRHGRVRRG